MNFALQKTLELALIIGLGLLMQRKVAKQDLKGLKNLILSIALPATIFVALLKIELKASLLIFPLLFSGLVLMHQATIILPLRYQDNPEYSFLVLTILLIRRP